MLQHGTPLASAGRSCADARQYRSLRNSLSKAKKKSSLADQVPFNFGMCHVFAFFLCIDMLDSTQTYVPSPTLPTLVDFVTPPHRMILLSPPPSHPKKCILHLAAHAAKALPSPKTNIIMVAHMHGDLHHHHASSLQQRSCFLRLDYLLMLLAI